jgi:Tfp pilus assembly protein PilN
LHLIRSGEGNFYAKQNVALQTETQKLLTENAQLRPFRDTQKTLEKHINAAYSFQFHRFIGIKMLNAITPIIPKDIYLIKLKFDRHLIELQGNATSNIAISNLVTKMDKTGFFTPAKIAEVSEEKYNNLIVTKFLITTNIKTDYENLLPEKKP